MAVDAPAEVLSHLAQEACRRYGPLAPEVPANLRRNIRRRWKHTMELARVAELLGRYKRGYEVGKALLPTFTTPAPGRYASVEDIQLEAFAAALRRELPEEPDTIRQVITWYVIHYEHLR